MATTTLPIGRAFTMAQNETYALPARSLLAYVQGSGIEQSNDGITWAAVTLDDDESFLAGATFIRSTAVDTIITLKG